MTDDHPTTEDIPDAATHSFGPPQPCPECGEPAGPCPEGHVSDDVDDTTAAATPGVDLTVMTPDVGDVDLRTLQIIDDDLERFRDDLAAGRVSGVAAAARLTILMENDPRILPPYRPSSTVDPTVDDLAAQMPALEYVTEGTDD